MLRKKVLLSIAAIIFTGSLIAFNKVDDPIDRIITKLTQWTENNPIEKVYLHTDRPFYAAGDDIWFEAYVTAGTEHRLSAISSVLNVELISCTDSIKKAIKIPIQLGTAAGDFSLPPDIPAGIYHLRAYTNYISNSAGDYLFDKAIAIGNYTGQPAAAVKINSPAKQAEGIDVQLFPEGGTLVNGLPAKVAYKAVGTDGLGVNINGAVTDEENNQVAVISAGHLGIGTFTFTPEKGKSYHATINSDGGTAFKVPVPTAVDAGFVLAIDNSATDKIVVKIAAGEATPATMLNLVAQQNGKVCYAAKPIVNNNGVLITIPKNRFATGIVQFTLFSPDAEPLNERIAFIQNPADLLKLSLNTDKQQYTSRQKVNVGLDVKNSDGHSVKGIFSVAVIDEKKVPADETMETTILNNLLLTSDLKGFIEKPNYYFTNENDKTRADLDALMLTQGYRRFVWKKILTNNVAGAPVFETQRALNVSGIVKTPGGRPLPKAKVTLTSTGGGFFEADTLTNENGRFTFNNLAFFDSTKFVVQAVKPSGSRDVILALDRTTRPPIAYAHQKNAKTVNNPDQAAMSGYLKNGIDEYNDLLKNGMVKKSIMLKEVSVSEKVADAVKYSSNLAGPGQANQIITREDLRQHACVRLFDCISDLMIGAKLRNGKFYSSRTQNLAAVPMYIVVDGIPMAAVDVQYLDANDVLSIEVLKAAGYTGAYGANGGGGVIVITTVNNARHPIGDWGETFDQKTPDVVVYSPPGFYKTREFYAPKYDDPKIGNGKADLRGTIFWQPKLVTGTDGKASFEYYNSDGKGTYRVVVEGIDGNGRLGRAVYRYKVE